MGIAGVDTRAITRRLRVTGCLNGAICTDASIPGAGVRVAACTHTAPGAAAALGPGASRMWHVHRARCSKAASTSAILRKSPPCPTHTTPTEPTASPPSLPPCLCRPPVCACADEELVALTKSWSIVGKDLIKEVTCKEPYQWKETTGSEWEFAPAGEPGRIKGGPAAAAAAEQGGAGMHSAMRVPHCRLLAFLHSEPRCSRHLHSPSHLASPLSSLAPALQPRRATAASP